MSHTVELLLAGVLGALVAVAVVLGRARLLRPDRRREPAGSSEVGRAEPAPPAAVTPGVASVLAVLRSSVVLLGTGDSVLQASAPAYALGLVRDDRLRQPELVDLVRQVRADGQVREAELELQRTRATPVHVLARVAPLGTQRVLVLVDDRTRERRVESIRRDFVANVSHELKTPVGALNLLAEAVAEARDDPEAVQRFSGRMLVETERLSRLVQQIIELSRLQADQLVDEPVEIDVVEVVRTAVARSRVEAEAKSIELRSRAVRPLLVRGDPEQILAAVSNLVENAVAYSPDHTRVAVVAERVGRDVTIMVSDQGVGITSDDRERIFERFYRVDPARARKTGGTGLGLSIVKHIAVSHGGSISVWSEPGQGSTFTLSLPALDDDLDDLDDDRDEPADRQDPGHRHGSTAGRPSRHPDGTDPVPVPDRSSPTSASRTSPTPPEEATP